MPVDETYMVIDAKGERWKITAFTRLSVEKNIGADADEFRAELPVGDEEIEKLKELKGETVRIYWNGVHVFSGLADEVSYRFSPTEGRAVGLVGRDFTGFLIDKQLSEGLANRLRGRAAGSAVQLIANEFGYKADVMAGTKAHPDLFHDGVPVWSVIRELAKKEGADVWCDENKVIHFIKVEPGEPKRAYLWPQDKIVSLSFSQDLTYKMGLVVTVEGYDPKGKRAIVATAMTPRSERRELAEIRVFDPNSTSVVLARQTAEAKLRELSGRFLTGEIILAEADPELRPGDTIQIDGVGWLSGRFVVSGITLTRRADSTGFEVRFRSHTLAAAEVRHE